MSSEQVGIHNQGNWSAAKNGGGVVSDQPGGIVRGGDEVEYYGGYLIAESMDRSNIPIVKAAPNMLKALVATRRAIVGYGAFLPELKMIDEAIAAATAPIAPAEFPTVVGKPAVEDTDPFAEPAIKYEDIDQSGVFQAGDEFYLNDSWHHIDESLGQARGSTWMHRFPCRRPVKQSPVEPIAQPVCEAQNEKPPLDIMPARLWIEARRDDIYAAVDRYRAEMFAVPSAWLYELAEIEDVLQGDNCEMPF